MIFRIHGKDLERGLIAEYRTRDSRDFSVPLVLSDKTAPRCSVCDAYPRAEVSIVSETSTRAIVDLKWETENWMHIERDLWLCDTCKREYKDWRADKSLMDKYKEQIVAMHERMVERMNSEDEDAGYFHAGAYLCECGDVEYSPRSAARHYEDCLRRHPDRERVAEQEKARIESRRRAQDLYNKE